MTYTAVSEMSKSQSLMQRVAGAAAEQGQADPWVWTSLHIWAVVARSDWQTAWSYAEDTQTINQNPDTGARDDVINDAMILSAVQAVIATP